MNFASDLKLLRTKVHFRPSPKFDPSVRSMDHRDVWHECTTALDLNHHHCRWSAQCYDTTRPVFLLPLPLHPQRLFRRLLFCSPRANARNHQQEIETDRTGPRWQRGCSSCLALPPTGLHTRLCHVDYLSLQTTLQSREPEFELSANRCRRLCAA